MADEPDPGSLMVDIPLPILPIVENLLSSHFRIVRLATNYYILLPHNVADQAEQIMKATIVEEDEDGNWTGAWIDPDVLEQVMGFTPEKAEKFFQKGEEELRKQRGETDGQD